MVLPDGTILDQLTTLRKDNTGQCPSPLTDVISSSTGYDLKQLFIGAEGTLGIVTGVSILTPPSPQASNNVILALPRFDNVLPLYQTVKRQLSEILSAFEFIDRTAYDLAVKHGQGRALSDEEVRGAECFVLVETSGGRREHDEEVWCCVLQELRSDAFPEIKRSSHIFNGFRQASHQHRRSSSNSCAILFALGTQGRSYRSGFQGGKGLQV